MFTLESFRFVIDGAYSAFMECFCGSGLIEAEGIFKKGNVET